MGVEVVYAALHDTMGTGGLQDTQVGHICKHTVMGTTGIALY